jgi:mono/diheme cytochrome c family protein
LHCASAINFSTYVLNFNRIMTKSFIRFSLYALSSLILFVAVAVCALLWNSHRKINRVISVAVTPVAYTNDASSVERGKYLYQARGCAECHGENGAGKTFINDPNGLSARGANLTLGSGSTVKNYTEQDWVRSIRHGIKPDGRPLFIMPSEDYARFSDKDVADIVAYVRALPAQETAQGSLFQLPLIVKLVYGAGILKDSAAKIDHSLPPAQAVPTGVTLEHGRYLVQTCAGCHGQKLEGGKIVGAPPDWPPAANLSARAGGVMSKYLTIEQFKTMMHTGVRPDGSKVNSAMPFQSFQHINDVDLQAMHLYLRSLSSDSTK